MPRNVSRIARHELAVGSPALPGSGVIDSQNSEWLRWPPTLLRTASRLSGGNSVSRVRISRGSASSRPVPASAALALSTYAWWCLSW